MGSVRGFKGMRRRVTVILCLAAVLGVTASRGEWGMRIHKNGSVEEHILSEIDSLSFFELYSPPFPMVTVPAGVFIMGDGVAYCGQDEHEVTNQEYLEALQWAYDHGYVTATTATVEDNLDYSTMELLILASQFCEIQFDGAGSFHLRESPSDYSTSRDCSPAPFGQPTPG